MVFRVLVLVFEHAAQSSIFAEVQDLSSHILFFPHQECMHDTGN